MSIILPPEVEYIADRKVKEGLYETKEDFIKQAVNFLDKFDRYKKYVNEAIDEGEASLTAGKTHTSEEFKVHFEKARTEFLQSRNIQNS